MNRCADCDMAPCDCARPLPAPAVATGEAHRDALEAAHEELRRLTESHHDDCECSTCCARMTAFAQTVMTIPVCDRHQNLYRCPQCEADRDELSALKAHLTEWATELRKSPVGKFIADELERRMRRALAADTGGKSTTSTPPEDSATDGSGEK